MKNSKRILRTCSLLVYGLFAAAMVQAQAATPPAGERLYATVNGTPITQQEFHTAFANHVRQTLYHGQVSEERVQAARKEVTDRMIERLLLLEEADRRQVSADLARIDETIAGYEQRYANSPQWKERRETLLPGLRKQLAEQGRLEKLEQAVRALPEPSASEVRAYYDAKPELFTEPEKLRVRTILLKVDPSSPAAAWDAARDEAARIVRQIREGTDMGELARLHSNDRSAAEGGDMGYLHVGMIPESLHAKIVSFTVGTISDPIDVLEGIGIFRLEDRQPAKLRGFDEVAKRARDLLIREQQEQAWKDLIARLRNSARIELVGSATSQ
jgi:parvulin-like peptidyl-prolyl isomerase